MLKNTWNQLCDLYFGMTAGSRIVAGLLIAVLIVALGFLLSSGTSSTQAKDVFLFNGYEFSGSEQRVVMEALANAGLKDYTWEGMRIKVPRKNAELYVAALSTGKAVPKDAVMTIMDSVNSSTPFDTKALMEGKRRAAMSLATSQSLRKIGGLDDAEVFIDETNVFKNMRHEKQRMASVLVMPQFNKELTPEMLGGIAGTVKNAFGIDNIENVLVIDKRTGRAWKGSEEWLEGGGNGSYIEKKHQAELHWERQFRDLLSDVEGLTVKVSVSLDRYISRSELDVQHRKPTIGVFKDEALKIDGKDAERGGRPGYEMQINTPLPLNKGFGTANSEYKYNENNSSGVNVMQGTETEAKYAPMTPKSLAASLRIPYGYFKRTWLLAQKEAGIENPEPNAAELDAWVTSEIGKMKELLIPLVKQGNENVLEDVEIAKLVTIEPYHMQEEIVKNETISATQHSIIWLSQNWKSLGLFGLIAASLVVLWGVTRPAKPEPIIIYEAPELPRVEKEFERAEVEEEMDEEARRTLEPFSKSMMSLQEEVSELVAENPDAAVNVLRQWIGKVVVQEH